MQINVMLGVFCFCYYFRCGFDIALTVFKSRFSSFRIREAAEEGNYIFSTIVLCFYLIVEYIPILMFMINMKFILHQYAILQPKMRHTVGFSSNPTGDQNVESQYFNGEQECSHSNVRDYKKSIIEDFNDVE